MATNNQLHHSISQQPPKQDCRHVTHLFIVTVILSLLLLVIVTVGCTVAVAVAIVAVIGKLL
jgi:hypothetical protein